MQKVLVENNADGTTLITINRAERRNAICAETALSLQKAFQEFERPGRQDDLIPIDVGQPVDRDPRRLPVEPIAILSLGATRRMSIRPKAAQGRTVHIELEAGSLLVMSHASQFTHEHGIPKVTALSGPRISLAFRCFVLA